MQVQTPARHPNLGLPDDAQVLLDSAKKAIREARDLKEAHQGSVAARGRKRKAAEITREEAEEIQAEGSPSLQADGQDSSILEDELPAPKRQRVMEIEMRKDRVKRRAAAGIAVGLAFGFVLSILVDLNA